MGGPPPSRLGVLGVSAMPNQEDWMKLSELLRRLAEQRERQATMRTARDRNNGSSLHREAFRHLDFTPTKPAKLGF